MEVFILSELSIEMVKILLKWTTSVLTRGSARGCFLGAWAPPSRSKFNTKFLIFLNQKKGAPCPFKNPGYTSGPDPLS